MIFLCKLRQLCASFDAGVCSQMDQAVLYGVFEQKPPLAKHIVFNPAPEAAVKTLVGNYNQVFPIQLLEMYRSINGANLFWSFRSMGDTKIRIPYNLLSLYGIPLSYDRKHLEPFNISVEDLNRPNGTPHSWLKFGSFRYPEDLSMAADLFVDTETEEVHAIMHGASEFVIVETWPSIDNCLCNVLDLCNSVEL